MITYIWCSQAVYELRERPAVRKRQQWDYVVPLPHDTDSLLHFNSDTNLCHSPPNHAVAVVVVVAFYWSIFPPWSKSKGVLGGPQVRTTDRQPAYFC